MVQAPRELFCVLVIVKKDTDKITISLTKNMGQDLLLEEQCSQSAGDC